MRIFVTSILLILAVAGCENKPAPATKAAANGAATAALVVEQVLVPAGEFVRGSNREDDPGMRQRYGFPAPLYLDEHPQKKLHLAAFKIDTYEVTNAQYKAFIFATRRMLPFAWMNNGYAITEERLQELELENLRVLAADHLQLDLDTREMDKPALLAAIVAKQKEYDQLPVGSVNWFAAAEFCKWRNSRLPTEAEWEKAARGPEGLEYPWGNEWDATITNTGDDGAWEEGIAPVGSYPRNKSVYGAYDMSGNVWEWVADWYEPYEGSTYQTKAFGQHHRVIRGGGGGEGHYAISYFFRGATRQFAEPEMETDDVGFRCVTDI